MKAIHKQETCTYSRIMKVKKIISMVVIFSFVFINFSKVEPVKASSVNVHVDYIDEMVYVTASTGSSLKFYMSTDQKNWDLIDYSGALDISSLLSTKPVTLYFKGNKETDIVSLPLDGEDKTLKVAYEIKGGDGRITYSYTGAVEYRKGANGLWKTAVNNMPTAAFEVRGATLYFRTPATLTKRAGKIVSVKIPKRPSATSVKLDGSKLCISGIKSGVTQYRIGDSLEWKAVPTASTKANYVDLLALINPTSQTNTQIPAASIEFRTLGTDKKLSTGVKQIDVTQQPIAPETITLKDSTITIADQDLKRTYEYTRVDKSATLDLNKAKWTSIKTNAPVIIPKASVGDKVYVRLKSTTDSKTKVITLASTYKEFTFASITVK